MGGGGSGSKFGRSHRLRHGYDLSSTALALLACLLLTAFFPWSETQAGQFTRTLAASGPVSLVVETDSGRIAVRRGEGANLVVHATIYSRHPDRDAERIRQIEQNPPIHQTGNRVQIGALPREVSRRLSISYDITAPAATSATLASGSGDIQVDGLQGTVHLETGSGSVEALEVRQGLHASTGSGDITARTVQGDCHLQTGSGSIHAYGLNGPATLSTGSGDITLAGSAQSTRADTGSGSIRATGLGGDFRARTGSGTVTAQGVLPDRHRWDLSTGSGSIDLSLPSSTHANVDLQTDSGTIHSSLPVQMAGKLSGHHLTGFIGGANPSAWLTARTGSGDIRVH